MNNYKLILPIILTFLAVALIVIAFVLKPKEKEYKPLESITENNSIVYRCSLTIKEENNTSYAIEELYVKDDIVLKSVPIMEMHYNNKTIYEDLKNNKEYSVGKTYNDKDLTIIFSNGDEKDMTKDINGKDMELKYSEYSKELEKVGYVCKEK